jgi:hypothetical protein
MPRSGFHSETIGPLPPKKRERPQCKWCGTPLEPVWDYTFPTTGDRKPSKAWSGRYGKGDGNFCRDLHALWWADRTIQNLLS